VNAETIPGLLALRAAESPQLEALVDENQRISYAQLEQRSAARASWLVARGVNKGHRVGLLMPNCVDWAVNAYAVMRIGAVLVPLSTLLRSPELSRQLAIAGVRHLIAAPAYRGRDYRSEIASLDRASLPSLRSVWWVDAVGNGGMQQAQAVACALTQLVTPADDLVVIFTSGSCGQPKGVIHTHGAAIRATAAGLADRCVRRQTRLYLPMPLFWIGGFGAGLISALVAGATLLTEATPEPGETLKFLARERATLFRGWPDQAARIASHHDYLTTDLSCLGPGSLDALLPPSLRARPSSRANLFGMTETFGPYCGYPLDQDLPHSQWGSSGRPFSGIELRIVDPGSGGTLPKGQIGNIQVGGRNLMRGICGREREDVFTPDGWYDGGDVGRLDDAGFLYFTGRRDDMVKVKGASVYPSEVEAALESIPGVRRAFATSICVDGSAAIGVAVVLDAPGALALEHLQSEARARLSAFKRPARWALLASIDELPRTMSGKPDKPALQSLLLSGAAQRD
jgi:acyl-CoA synthetase (AMP-forming)/AMP-acid ligase II